MVKRRGDNIPSIDDYSHWGEEASRVWYEENKYDMQYADEIIEDDDFGPDPDSEPKEEFEFDSEEEARKFFETQGDSNLRHFGNIWVVEVY